LNPSIWEAEIDYKFEVSLDYIDAVSKENKPPVQQIYPNKNKSIREQKLPKKPPNHKTQWYVFPMTTIKLPEGVITGCVN
jgi:hypothetical protein